MPLQQRFHFSSTPLAFLPATQKPGATADPAAAKRKTVAASRSGTKSPTANTSGDMGGTPPFPASSSSPSPSPSLKGAMDYTGSSGSGAGSGEKSTASLEEEVTRALRRRQAENRLKVADLFASDTVHEYIETTEVNTLSGMRWLDITASEKLRQDNFLSHMSEGQFGFCVMKALFGARFPTDVSANVATGFGLPATYVDRDWACVVLRCRKEVGETEGEFSGLSNRLDRYRFKRGRSLERLAAAASLENLSQSSGCGGRGFSRDRLAEAEPMGDDGPRGGGASQEETSSNIFTRFVRTARRRFDDAFQWPRRFRRSRAGAGPSVGQPVEYRSPLTLTDFTDRLTIFIGKELHPVNRFSDAQERPTTPKHEAPAAEQRNDEQHLLSLRTPKSLHDSDRGKGSASASSTNESTSAVRWRVVTVHQSPISFIQDLQTQWNELTTAGIRSRRVEEESKRVRGRRSTTADDDEEESMREVHEFDEVYGATMDRVNCWEDLLRVLFHRSTRSLQESAYRNTRRLESMEMEMFEFRDTSAEHVRAMKRLMARLHLLSRKSTISTAILRESKMAYTKLKKVLDEPLTAADERELLYVDSVLAMTAYLEEQSESLLFLQFSLAMGQMEARLRTLTVFSTFFIPLDFIVSCFGSNISSLQVYDDSEAAMQAVFALLILTSLLTYGWIRRNLQ